MTFVVSRRKEEGLRHHPTAGLTLQAYGPFYGQSKNRHQHGRFGAQRAKQVPRAFPEMVRAQSSQTFKTFSC